MRRMGWGLALGGLLLAVSAWGAEIKFPFADGSAAVFVFEGSDHRTFYESREGDRRLLSSEKILVVPKSDNVEYTGERASVGTYDSNCQRLAVVQTSAGAYVITARGDFQKLPANYGGADLARVPTGAGEARNHKGLEYVRLSIYHRRPRETASEVFIVREDGLAELLFAIPERWDARLKEILDKPRRTAGNRDESKTTTGRELVLVSPSAANAPENTPGTYHFRFPSGRELVFEVGPAQSRVRWRDGEEIAAERIRAFPNVLIPSQRVPGVETPPTYKLETISFFETENRLWVAFGNGTVAPLTVDTSRLEHAANFPVILLENFSHGGKAHVIVSFPYRGGAEGEFPGETYVFREDGVSAQIDFRRRPVERKTQNWKVTSDGFLIVKDAARAIDLDHFPGEAMFPVQPMGKVMSERGGDAVSNPHQAVRDQFTEMTAQANARTFTLKDTPALKDLRVALQKHEAGSAVILGDAGTGKTEFVRSFVAGIRRGDFPEIPRTTRVFRIDAATLSQGTKYVGTFEARLKLLLEVCKTQPCILFMDEIHSLRGQGTHESQKNDFFQMLKTPLAEGWLKIVGTSTHDEFNAQFAGDEALMRRFTPVWMEAPKAEDLTQYLRGWLARYRQREPAESVLQEVIRISDRFSAIGAQPAKANELLDFTYSLLRVEGRANDIPTIADVHRAAMRRYKLDPARFDSAVLRKKVLSIPAQLEAGLIGQPEYKRALYESAVQALAGVTDPSRPAVRILVAGPRGIGKTEGAKIFAETMELPSHVFEMNHYATPYDVERFKAALAGVLRKNPFTVLILDEIEKAHPQVQQALLAVMEAGFFTVDEQLSTSSKGGTRIVKVDARHASFIATTNAGERAVLHGQVERKAGYGFQPLNAPPTNASGMLRTQGLREALVADGIPDPLVDRFPWIVAAVPPAESEFRGVLELRVQRACAEQAARLGVRVGIVNERAFVDAMVARYYRADMSNRTALHIVQEYLRRALGHAIVVQGATGRPLEFHYEASSDSLRLAGVAEACLEDLKSLREAS